MPILTPAYPTFNSTFNITITTKAIILQEFRWASKILNNIYKRKACYSLSNFFSPLNFFKLYKFYVVIKLCFNDESEIDRIKGFIESWLKKLVHLTENQEVEERKLPALVTLHPWPNAMPGWDKRYHFCYDYYFGVNVQEW